MKYNLLDVCGRSFLGGVRYKYCTVLSWSVVYYFENAYCGSGCNFLLLNTISLSLDVYLLPLYQCSCSYGSLVVPHLKPLLLSGYLIGYLVHRKKDLASPTYRSAATTGPFEEVVPHETGAAPLMDWDDVKKLLAQKLSVEKFESVFR